MSRPLLLTLAIALLLSACAHPLQRGRSALDEKNYERAEAIAQKAIERQHDDPRSHLLYAEVLVAQKRYAEALPYARRAAHGEAEGATALTLYGDILGKLQEDPQLRARAYDRALQLDPTALPQEQFTESLQHVTQAQLSPWDEPERLWATERLFHLDPDFVADLDPQTLAEQMHVVAQVHVAKGDLKEGFVFMGNAIERFGDPDLVADRDLERAQRAHAWKFEMGELLLRRGHRRHALESWKDYLDGISELSAESPRAQLGEADRRYLYVGQSARFYGDAELAAGIWRAAVGLEPGDVLEGVELPEHPSPAVIAERLGWLELMRDEPDAAYAAYTRMAEDTSRSRRLADVHEKPAARILEFARYLEWAEAPELALAYLELADRFVEFSLHAFYGDDLHSERALVEMRARLYLETDQEPQARELLRAFVAKAPADPSVASRPHEPVFLGAAMAVALERPQWAREMVEAVENDGESTLDLETLSGYGKVLGHMYDTESLRQRVEERVAAEADSQGGDARVRPAYERYAYAAQIFQDAGLSEDARDYAIRAYEEGPAPPEGVHRGLMQALSADDNVRRLADKDLDLDLVVKTHFLKNTVVEFTAEILMHLTFSSADDLRDAAELFRLAGSSARALEAIDAYLAASGDRAQALEPYLKIIRELDADARRQDLLEAFLKVQPDDPYASLELSELYLSQNDVHRSLVVLQDFIDALPEGDTDAAKRELVATFGQWDQEWDPRPLLNLLVNDLEAAEPPMASLLMIAEVFVHVDTRMRRFSDERRLAAESQFEISARDIAAYWYGRFLAASEAQDNADAAGRTWSELGEELFELELWELAHIAWNRAERRGEEVAPLKRVQVLLKVGEGERADAIIAGVLSGEVTFPSAGPLREVVETLVAHERIDEARGVLNLALVERSASPHLRPSYYRQLRTLTLHEEDPVAFLNLVNREQDRPSRRDVDVNRTLLTEAGLVETYVEVRDANPWRARSSSALPESLSIDAPAGDVAGVEEALNAALSPLSESSGESWREAAEIWANMGEEERALRALEMANQREDRLSAPDLRYPTRKARAQWLAAAGDGEGAMHLYEYRRDVYPPVLYGVEDRADWFGFFRAHHHHAQAERIARELVEMPGTYERDRAMLRAWLEAPVAASDDEGEGESEGEGDQRAKDLLERVVEHELASEAAPLSERLPPYHRQVETFIEGAGGEFAPEALEAFVTGFQNRRDVRMVLVEGLIDAGFYEAAMVVAQQGIDALPTDKNLELGMKAALYAAQPATFIELFGRRRVISDGVTRFLGAHDAENVDAEAARLLAASVGEAEAASVAAAAGYLRQIRRSDIDLLVTHLLALRAAGATDAARENVGDFLDRREPTPRLRHDVAEALAGRVDEDTIAEIIGWFDAQP